jgi:DNA-nicking Smr family endonuclease
LLLLPRKWEAFEGMHNSRENSDLIFQHLDRYGIRDKDAMADLRKKSREKKPAAALKTRRGVVRKRLDLHGMTVDRALPVLRQAIDECMDKGIGELLVIHGYGMHSQPGERGVLKKAVLEYLDQGNNSRIRDVTSALSKDGGEGATLVRFA